MDSFKELVSVHLHDAFVINEPLLINAINEILVFVEIELDAEHDNKVFTFGCLQRSFITAAVYLDSFLPRQISRNAGIAVKEMIGNDHSAVTLAHHVGNIIFTVDLTAFAGFACMKMRLV